MKYFLGIICLLSFIIAEAQENSAFLIPDSLRKGADVVNRNEEYILTIKSPAKFTVYERHVYTILNSAAASYAHYKTNYDKFCSINSLSGKLFNMMGKEIKHTKKSDWADNSAYDGFSLLSDARYKTNEFYSSDYPYTVEYEEEDEFNGTQYFPSWRPQTSPFMSVQNSKFTIIAPADYVVRYKQSNFNGEPQITQKGETKTYTWEIKNITAKKFEEFAPSFFERAPAVFFAPSRFEVQGFSGDMSSWNSYGKFVYQLVKGRDELPDAIKKRVHELTDNLKDPKEKIFTLYDFLQRNTRYISIQLGIGGWQPFEASYVAEKKYGDCKALSNFMIALLKEAGIQGKYVEIFGGKSPPPFIADFSYSQFNHVISCVPLEKDTVWLECTSQTVSPGYMGSFTGDRNALLIDETGGHLVHTPVYKVGDNVKTRIVKAVSDEQGNLSAEIIVTSTGLQQDFSHSLLYNATKEEREKYLNQMFNLPTYKVIKSEYREERGIIPAMSEYMKIELTNFANITGKRLFIAPNIFGGASEKIPADTARQNTFVSNNAYRNIDSVEIAVPAGYQAESVPNDISIETRFGKYVSSVKVFKGKIVYYRMMEKEAGRFPASDFAQIVKFYDQIYKSDRARVVLIKTE